MTHELPTDHHVRQDDSPPQPEVRQHPNLSLDGLMSGADDPGEDLRHTAPPAPPKPKFHDNTPYTARLPRPLNNTAVFTI
jgi:hypothetical protein